MIKVERADDCIWIRDERGELVQGIHLVPEQAKAVGVRLIEAAAADGEYSEQAWPEQ